MKNALNSYFEEQAKIEGKCLVDYAQFDNTFEYAFLDTPVANAKATLDPRGSTALLDAIGRSVTTLGEKLAKLSESNRPGKILVVIVTDGYENASQEWTYEAVSKLVTEQTDKYNWNFVFLGANMDAPQVGKQLGISYGSSITYDMGSLDGTSMALSNYTTALRSAGAAAFSDEDRKRAEGK